MTTTVTTHSTSVRVSMMDTLVDTASMSPQASMSLPSSPTSMTGVSGLLNSRNLVQDEKLVVATLATLDSGSASNLIKQDLKWIIQSRRKAEGKSELQVEFKKPVKDELTSEELIKRARRRELNRLAARRSREKGQKRKDMLVEEIRKLQSQNSELINILGDLTLQRNNIIDILRQHMKQCSDYRATQTAAVGMSQRVLDLLGFSSLSTKQTDIPGVSSLYISSGEQSSTPPLSQSPSATIKKERYAYSSCPSSPLVVGLSGKLIKVEDPSPTVIGQQDEPSSVLSSSIYSVSSPVASFSKSLPSVQFASFELPLQPLTRPVPVSTTSRSSTHDPDVPSAHPATSDDYDHDEEVVHYRHKLMKHRKQSSSDFTKPLPSGARAARVSLERSFSFPSTVRESRSSLGSSSPGSYTVDLTQTDSSTAFHGACTPPSAALDPGIEEDDCDSPLDLAVKPVGSRRIDSDDEKQFGACPMDTWPPPGSKSGIISRNLERRWSVDDRHSLPQSVQEPLNLSSRDVSEDEGVALSQTSTTTSSESSSPSVTTRLGSKYSRFMLDPYS